MLKEKKSAIILKSILGLLSVGLLYGVMDGGGMQKYAVAIFLCAVYMVLGRKKKFDLREIICVVTPSLTYIILGGVGVLFGASPQLSAIKVLLYCIVPMLLSIMLYIYYDRDISYFIDAQFVCGIVLYLANSWVEIFLPIIRAYKSNLIVLIREFRWESSFAFAFGIFAVYYAYKRRWGMFVLASIFAYIGNKRIVLLAMAAALGMMALTWLFQKSKKLIYVSWGIICAAVYGYLTFIYSRGMSFWSEVFNLNSNGRLKIYDRIMTEFEFSLGYMGKGLGVIENLLEHWNIPTFANLHNDLMKFYIEIGFWGLLIYLLSYYVMFYLTEKIAGDSAMMYLLGILNYTFVLFTTDNVSIYLLYLIPFYTTIFAVLSYEKAAAQRRNLNAKESN